MAARLLRASLATRTRAETAQAARLGRMMADARGKAFTFQMVDQVFRSHNAERQGERYRHLIEKFGAPRYLTIWQRLLVRMADACTRVAPQATMGAVQAQLRRDTAQVILPGEPGPLQRYLAARRASGTGVILNQLGEAILGEDEAARRLEAILRHLAHPGVQSVSVKISAIFSQINLLDWDGTVAAVSERLRRLYRAALAGGKFVNLDMEEYRDLQLTVELFERVLGEPEFHRLRAGIVLQAYLPDCRAAQEQLTQWAQTRVAAGGAPIKVRLVKGANLAMERVDAELHGWVPAPYGTKAETDANFCRMLDYACHPDRARAVNLGVGSHNLFDVALALALREERQVQPWVELEMLEGMANHQARAAQAAAGGLLLYAPVVEREDFTSAMAYLIRRLDENTAPENFLRDLFALELGSAAWERQRLRFIASWEGRHEITSTPRRLAPRPERPVGEEFRNVPDSDWTQAAARDQLKGALASWRRPAIPPAGDLNATLEMVASAQPDWEAWPVEKRAAVLRRCAEVMQRDRFALIACMVHEAKKAPAEGDVEVSEAIDYARYYAESYRPPAHLRAAALGVVVVAPPWNFPYAIPCGGVLAALMAGNGVVLKPAPETVATAWHLAQRLWEAGVPPKVLQFFPCEDGPTGRALITDARVSAVVLTGAYDTARLFLGWRPGLRLLAETSGKNALVITAQADRDLAIKDLVKSAFGHSGQKCSAASLAILEAELYDDRRFRANLRDAAASLRVGPATDCASVLTPLIRPPGESLRRALTLLDPGEEWLLEPRPIGDDPCLWSPGIKLGVKPEGWFHRTECFGPVLGLVRARDLEEAIGIQNGSPFGLTGGLHSLDEREIALWRERVEVGNGYVNRAITGAIVRRQPFGGWKHSYFGPGAKAGGPNYVNQFARLEEVAPASLESARASYAQWWKEHFSIGHDPSTLRGESNVFRYRPCRGVILRVEEGDGRAIALARWAAETCGVRLHVSIGPNESEAALAARLPGLAGEAEFLRTVRPPSDELLSAAWVAGLNWINGPLLAEGRYELTHWLREQSLSETRHRYGLIVDTS